MKSNIISNLLQIFFFFHFSFYFTCFSDAMKEKFDSIFNRTICRNTLKIEMNNKE